MKHTPRKIRLFSTFTTGLTPVISRFLCADISLHFLNQWDGFVEYTTDVSQLTTIQHLPYLHNTFIIIDSSRCDIHSMINLLSRDNHVWRNISLPRELMPNPRKPFRVVISDQNELISIQREAMSRIEKRICTLTKRKADRWSPGYQFWILHRSEGYSFFAFRLTELKKEEKSRAKGELRPQLAYVLARLSEPKENELFLDPCCGGGSIALSRARMTKTGLVIASDIDGQLITKLKEKVRDLRIKKKIVVRQANALSLHQYYHTCVHKIVSDPPWGFFEQIHDVYDFYNTLINEMLDALVPTGLLVLLVGNDIFPKVLEKFTNRCRLIEKYDVLVSGRKASIYKIIKK